MEDRLDTVVPALNLITCVERLLVEPLLHVMVNSVGLTLVNVFVTSFPSIYSFHVRNGAINKNLRS